MGKQEPSRTNASQLPLVGLPREEPPSGRPRAHDKGEPREPGAGKRREKEMVAGVGVRDRSRNVSEIQRTPSTGAPDPRVCPVSARPPTPRREGPSREAISANESGRDFVSGRFRIPFKEKRCTRCQQVFREVRRQPRGGLSQSEACTRTSPEPTACERQCSTCERNTATRFVQGTTSHTVCSLMWC